ncbi:MAG TPA: hypothetical protein VGC74_14960 [Stenotrophomonas sp.]
MKHGIALLAAGLVLLSGALVVARPPQALAASTDQCLEQMDLRDPLAWRCQLRVEMPRIAFISTPYGDNGTAAIFLIGGLAALGGGLVALRSGGGRLRHAAAR